MNVRSRGIIAVFLMSCVFFWFVCAAPAARADSGEGAGGGLPDGTGVSGPSVITVGAEPGPDAGEDASGGEPADPAEDPGEGT